MNCPLKLEIDTSVNYDDDDNIEKYKCFAPRLRRSLTEHKWNYGIHKMIKNPELERYHIQNDYFYENNLFPHCNNNIDLSNNDVKTIWKNYIKRDENDPTKLLKITEHYKDTNILIEKWTECSNNSLDNTYENFEK